MKIEKINENQIRATLGRSDFASRHLKISELAYGSEKAKKLFNDLMEQAAYQYGFDADNIPLMIEAIPVSSDCVVLIITKVDDPEELDTRFSKFSESSDNYGDEPDDFPYEDFTSDDLDELPEIETTDEDIFSKIKNMINDAKKEASLKATDAVPADMTFIYTFNDYDTFEECAKIVNGGYNISSALYKDLKSSLYYLVLNTNGENDDKISSLRFTLSEYGTLESPSKNRPSYIAEHMDCIIKKHAVEIAAKI